MQLFSSFAILMNFERFGKMKGMSNIVRWSIRDESLHVEGMTRLFREFYNEYWSSKQYNMVSVDQEEFANEIAAIADKMVELEDNFIDLCFGQADIKGVDSGDLKQYIRFISNKRWSQLGFSGTLYDVTENPLPWLDWVINGVEHTNFFEAKPTDYSKGTLTGEVEQW
jgi:ribonucleoside-diphosphate reductase beta chain